MSHENSVTLLGYYGGDNTHGQSAWTSTNTELDQSRVQKLLAMLAKNDHHTPFEKSLIHFNVVTDIATHIQLLKHRIGVSINGESARYKELKDDNKFYIPQDWNEEWQTILTSHNEVCNTLYHKALSSFYNNLITNIPVNLTEDERKKYTTDARKRAKESARFFRSYSSQISADISFNWRSFVHFYKLRAASDAQLEIQILAKQMLELIKTIPENPFKYTIEAFNL